MTKFVYIYYGQDEATDDVMEKWNQWFATFEDKIVEWGNPFAQGYEVTAEKTIKLTPEQYPATGYTTVEVTNFAEAEAIAKRCPSSSGLRVYEAVLME